MAFAFNPFTGTLDFYQPATPPVPLQIATGATFTVTGQQYAPLDIVADGELIIDGELVFG